MTFYKDNRYFPIYGVQKSRFVLEEMSHAFV